MRKSLRNLSSNGCQKDVDVIVGEDAQSVRERLLEADKRFFLTAETKLVFKTVSNPFSLLYARKTNTVRRERDRMKTSIFP